MSVDAALADFHRAFDAMLQAADAVRAAVLAQAGVKRSPVERIQETVARHYHLTREVLLEKRKLNHIAQPRMIAMWICRQLGAGTAQSLGDAFSQRNHGTVLHAEKIIGDRASVDPKFARELELIRAKCEAALRRA